MLRYLLTLAIALTAMASVCEAQYSGRNNTPEVLRGLYVHGKAGVNKFFGDVDDSGTLGYGGQLTVSKEVIKPLAARIDIDGGIIKGEGHWGESFQSTYIGFTAGADLMLINLIYGYNTQRTVDPYVSAGFGPLFFMPSNDFMETKASLNEAIQKLDGMHITFHVWGAFGCRYMITKNWGVNMELGGKLPLGNSDMLDGHDSGDGVVVTRGDISGYPEAIEQIPHDSKGDIYLGNGKFDMFYTAMVGVTYKFADMQWKASSKYNRTNYLKTRKSYKRNVERQKRR